MSDVLFTSVSVDVSGKEIVTFASTSIAQTESRGAAVVAGQVFDLCTGKAVANASVTLSSPTTVGNAVTDTKGHFKIAAVGDGI